jgi:hypothetical protein
MSVIYNIWIVCIIHIEDYTGGIHVQKTLTVFTESWIHSFGLLLFLNHVCHIFSTCPFFFTNHSHVSQDSSCFFLIFTLGGKLLRVSLRKLIIFFKNFYARWGYIATLQKFLQKNISRLSSPPPPFSFIWLLPHFNKYHFSIYTHVYTEFALYSPSCALSSTPPPSHWY